MVTMAGLFAFEIARANTAREQLRSACEAAALAGCATLASSDKQVTTDTHVDSLDAALITFRRNSILGISLAAAQRVSMDDHLPEDNQASLFIEFLDPNSAPPNQPISALSDPNGRIVHVVGAFGLTPAFAAFTGTPSTVLRAHGHGRVPQLDIVMCFDVSGSIDDQTNVTFVKRNISVSTGLNQYTIISARGGAPTTGGLAHGRLFDILGGIPQGTPVQATYPQTLHMTSDTGYHSRPLFFDRQLRGSNTSGRPGSPGVTGSNANFAYTDLVVNLDNKTEFGGITIDGYDFPTVASLVEASRGNLESESVFQQSGAKNAPEVGGRGVVPKSGYQAKYFEKARALTQPIGAARDAALAFFKVMNTNTEAHFGFTSFSYHAATASGQSNSEWSIAQNYSPPGTANFVYPGVPLSKTQTNYTEVTNAIGQTLANGGTNMNEAVTVAINQLKNNSRKGAKRTIILFTDGQWNDGGDPRNDAAIKAKTEGIAVYTVGLAQNSGIIPLEVETLNDGQGKTYNYVDTFGSAKSYTANSNGVAAIAGNGGKFYLVTDSRNLRLVFENIARQLVQLVKG
jgi:hypothetical protein